MLVEAKLRYARISPRKFRLVANLIRGQSVKKAENILKFTIKRPAKPMLKLLNSAVSNAEHNFNLKKENLYISEIRVDGGPILKRFMPRARGSVSPIQKKTSHVFIGLQDFQESERKEKEEKKTKKDKIKEVYKSEKPKEDKDISKKQKSTETPPLEEKKVKEPKTDKKSMFRRKSM